MAKRRRWILRSVLLAAVSVFLGLAAVRCAPPKSFKAVKQPRPGRALDDRVAIVYSKHYQINMLGAERLHSFDIRKYAKIYLKLQTEGLLDPNDVFVPESVTDEQILLVHTSAFLESLNDSATVARYLEAPIVAVAPAALVDAGILNAFRYATGGTILAGREALKHGVAVNLAGGYHHAMPDHGEGFNVYNDLAIAVRTLQKEGLIRRAMVVDLDVHQGNGTAVCFAGDRNVYTFDMYERDIYPAVKQREDCGIPLAAGTDDATYLKLLRKKLPAAIDAARPDIVFIQAGCDPLADDPLARLRLTPDGIVQRDAIVIDECVRRGIPVVMTLGGGYSDRAWEAQYASVARTIRTHGPAATHPRRSPTVPEKLYVK